MFKAGDEIKVVANDSGNVGSQGVILSFDSWSNKDWVQIKFHHKIGVQGNLVKTNYLSWIPLSTIELVRSSLPEPIMYQRHDEHIEAHYFHKLMQAIADESLPMEVRYACVIAWEHQHGIQSDPTDAAYMGPMALEDQVRTFLHDC